MEKFGNQAAAPQTSDPFHQVFLVWGEIQVLHQRVEGRDERGFHQGRLFEAADAGFCNTGAGAQLGTASSAGAANTDPTPPPAPAQRHRAARTSLTAATRNPQQLKGSGKETKRKQKQQLSYRVFKHLATVAFEETLQEQLKKHLIKTHHIKSTSLLT